MEKFILENIRDFNLDHIFDCGQCFRWKKEIDGSYTGTAFGKVVNMDFEYEEGSDNRGRLIINGATKEDFDDIWKDYLDLDRDYGKIKHALAEKDEIIAGAIEKGRGIRILKQDLWETIVSFIISQNNNIPRIKGCIEKLSKLLGTPAENCIEGYDIAKKCAKDDESFGKEITSEKEAFYNIPSAEVLASLTIEDLAEVRLGYRAKYLIESAKTVVENGLPTNYDELCNLTGVGPKVANCISLFGLGNMDSFPVDVWVKRVMNRLYGLEEKNVKAIMQFAEENFADLGGIAQQYLFYYIRETDKE